MNEAASRVDAWLAVLIFNRGQPSDMAYRGSGNQEPATRDRQVPHLGETKVLQILGALSRGP